jgi:hypothetical protein
VEEFFEPLKNGVGVFFLPRLYVFTAEDHRVMVRLGINS